MNGRVTTHVLDLSRGVPAEGVALQLWKIDSAGGRQLLREAVTNSDGRLDAPLLAGSELEPGSYELLFMAGQYFRSSNSEVSFGRGEAAEGPGSFFLEEIPVRFTIADSSAHYHVPLLVAPGGYSTYRGS